MGRGRAPVLVSSGFPTYTAALRGVRDSPFPCQVLSSFQDISRCLALSTSCGADGCQQKGGPTFSHLWSPKRCFSSEDASGSSQPQETHTRGLALYQDTFHVTLRQKALSLTLGTVPRSRLFCGVRRRKRLNCPLGSPPAFSSTDCSSVIPCWLSHGLEFPLSPLTHPFLPNHRHLSMEAGALPSF